jgi:hypothetical protein
MNIQSKILNIILTIYLLILALGGIWFIGTMMGTTQPILIIILSLLFIATIGSVCGFVFSIKNIIVQKTNSLITKGTYLMFSPIIFVILILFIAFITQNQLDMGVGFLITYGFTLLGSILFVIGNVIYIIGSLRKKG